MKKSVIFLILTVMSLTFAPQSVAAPTDPVIPANNTEAAAEAQVLINRLNEIKDMDKSHMTHREKKVLRKEVKTIKAKLAATGNGIYLSIGAIIIIILLLILLL